MENNYFYCLTVFKKKLKIGNLIEINFILNF